MAPPPNKLLSIVQKIHKAGLPDRLQQAALSLAFNSQIKYAGTTGIRIHQWQPDQAIVSLKNRRHIQNHIGGIHATAMATLAESATGMIFGLHVPDTHVPLLKSMKVHFVARASGDLTAVATLSQEQQEIIQTTDRGSLIVPVKVTDSEGKEPIQCEMEWAWTTKTKKQPPSSSSSSSSQPQSKL
jgi:acyl-coenzyme A thioesterase PaaI-like protein